MLAVTFTLAVVPAVAQAKKPLICAFELVPGPQLPRPEWGPNTWWGPIRGDLGAGYFEGYLFFYKTGGKAAGQSRHFVEVWMITDEEENMLLWGTDKGVFVPLKNPNFRMSGAVVYATSPYAPLIGRNVYMSGLFNLQELEAEGTFRVN